MVRTYGERDRTRGVPATVAWLAEEVGELARAARKGTRARAAARARRRARVARVVGEPARPLARRRGRALRRWMPALPRLPCERVPSAISSLGRCGSWLSGGGMAGLGTALACARDGHRRDDPRTRRHADAGRPPTPRSSGSARGAPQVRHSHAFLARLRNLLRDRAPDVLDALLAAGATEIPFTADLPADAHRPRRRARATRIWSRSRAGARRSSGCCGALVLARAGRRAARTASRPTRARRRRRRPSRASRVSTASPPISSSTRAGPRSSSDDWLAAIGAAAGRRGAARERHRLLLALLPAAARRRLPADGGPGRRRPRLPEVRDLPRRQRHVLDHVRGRRATTRSCAARSPTPDAFEAVGARRWSRRAVARDGRRRADHRRARDGRAAQPLPPARRRRRADRARLRRGRRRVGVHEPALRPRAAASRSCTRSGSPTRCASTATISTRSARAFAAFTERELVPWFRSAVVQDEQARAHAAKSCRPRIRGRSCRRSSATACCPRCARRRSCSARSCAGSTCSRTPDALMNDPEVVNEVLAAYQDRDEPPRARPASAPTVPSCSRRL